MPQILTRAHDELYRRTPDERFATMQDLWDSCHDRKQRSELLWRSADDLLAIPRERRLELATTPIDSHRMNSWSFGQLCGIAGVSRDTVNRLTPETAAKVFEETMPKGGKPMQLYADGDLIRSIHGASYTRLHDVELLTMLKEFATDFVPPQESGAPGSSGGSGLYCGEQDMFCFLIDPSGWTEINGQAFAPGFFIWNSDVGRVAVAAKVAIELLAIRAIDDRLDVLDRALLVDQEFVEITGARARGRLVSELDMFRAERAASVNRAAREPLRAERRAAEYRIAVLLGERPGSITVSEQSQADAPPLPPLGLPAELLDRRPDIRSAERAYAAAVARIGAAEGDRYPRLTLGGSFVLGGADLGDLVDPDSRVLSFGPRVTVPLFDGGRFRSNITRAESEARAARLRLERQALDAVREVENALTRLARARDREAALAAAFNSAVDSERLARSLCRAGSIDFIEVLEARTERLAIEDLLATARSDLLRETVNLSVALGGGWDIQSETIASRQSTPEKQ